MNTTPPIGAVTAHPDVFIWLFGIVLAIAVGSLIYHIRKSDINNDNQWQSLIDHESRISHQAGKCEGNHALGRRTGDV